MPLTVDGQVNKKAFRIAINSRQLARFHPLDREKTDFLIPAESDFEVPVVDLDYRGKGLQLQFTVEDDNVFTTPWSATVTYRRPLGGWLEYVCAENTRESGQRVRQLPQADKPDF
jgi:hypothetical protein